MQSNLLTTLLLTYQITVSYGSYDQVRPCRYAPYDVFFKLSLLCVDHFLVSALACCMLIATTAITTMNVQYVTKPIRLVLIKSFTMNIMISTIAQVTTTPIITRNMLCMKCFKKCFVICVYQYTTFICFVNLVFVRIKIFILVFVLCVHAHYFSEVAGECPAVVVIHQGYQGTYGQGQ